MWPRVTVFFGFKLKLPETEHRPIGYGIDLPAEIAISTESVKRKSYTFANGTWPYAELSLKTANVGSTEALQRMSKPMSIGV